MKQTIALILFIIITYIFLGVSFKSHANAKRNELPCFSLGIGPAQELTNLEDSIPGLSIALKNYLKQRIFYLQTNSDIFFKNKNNSTFVDISGRLTWSVFTNEFTQIHLGLGPVLRTGYSRDSDNTILSILTLAAAALEYKYKKNWSYEASIENKIGFSHKADVVFSLKVFKKL